MYVDLQPQMTQSYCRLIGESVIMMMMDVSGETHKCHKEWIVRQGDQDGGLKAWVPSLFLIAFAPPFFLTH